MNIWSPAVTIGDFSATAIVIGGVYQGVHIELGAGWMVNVDEFHDGQPRIFASYKVNEEVFGDEYSRLFASYKIGDTVCYSFNPSCTGFVITNPRAYDPIRKPSISLGAQYTVSFTIIQNNGSKDWVLQTGGKMIGWWKSNIVGLGMEEAASKVGWGGQIFRSILSPKVTPMGSGKSPEGGYGKASYIRDMTYINKAYLITLPNNLRLLETDRKLYRASQLITTNPRDGPLFFYGGPDP